MITQSSEITIVPFSIAKQDKKLLRKFVDFHWTHYQGDHKYIPLLDYEYVGSKLLGISGFFEPDNLFFQHGEVQLFLAMRGDEVVGRCNGVINRRHNEHWKDRVGFFGNFECIDDSSVAQALLKAAEQWLRSKGMTHIRGPQNFPINEATPGVMIEGYDSRPVIYYHLNKTYYKDLLFAAGYQGIANILSWEIPVKENSIEESLGTLVQRIVKRNEITIEKWGDRPFKVRKKEMFEIYNDAWSDNFGFVPFTEKEFDRIITDMQMIMDKDLFIFLYVKGKSAAFFGGVPNIAEILSGSSGNRRIELLRAVKLLVLQSKIKGFRLGYLGVKKEYRKQGLDGVMLWNQCLVAKKLGYEYCDIGWTLESNTLTVRLVERYGAKPSKKYLLFEKALT